MAALIGDRVDLVILLQQHLVKVMMVTAITVITVRLVAVAVPEVQPLHITVARAQNGLPDPVHIMRVAARP